MEIEKEIEKLSRAYSRRVNLFHDHEPTIAPVIIELSDRTAKHFGDTPESVARALLEKAALEDYRSERISLGKLSEILGFDRWKTETFLDQHHARHPYTVEMLEEDRRNLERILGPA